MIIEQILDFFVPMIRNFVYPIEPDNFLTWLYVIGNLMLNLLATLTGGGAGLGGLLGGF